MSVQTSCAGSSIYQSWCASVTVVHDDLLLAPALSLSCLQGATWLAAHARVLR